MACPVTTVSFLPQLLAMGALGVSGLGFLVSRALESMQETHTQGEQKSLAKTSQPASSRVAPIKPRVVTRMKDLNLLQSLLSGAGRTLTETDRKLVLTMKELALAFDHDAEGVIVATLARGNAKLAKQILEDAQARYVGSVREGVRERVQVEAPRAGWNVAAQEIARDGSVQITLQKARPKRAVAIG